MNHLTATLLDILITVIALMIPVVVPILTKRLFDWLGAAADAEYRKAISDALVNGLAEALASRRKTVGDSLTPGERTAVILDAADYVARNLPETVRKLGVSKDQLQDNALARLPQVLGQVIGTVGTVVGGPAGAPVGTIAGHVAGAALEAAAKPPARRQPR